MFFIDKHIKKNQRRGHSIVNRFLKDAWNPAEKRYVNCNYASFKKTDEMLSLLIEEQEGFCCYCMRHLEEKSRCSIEHVMPRKSVKADSSIDWDLVNYYKRFNKNFYRNIVYKHLDGYGRPWRAAPPYPHFCGYENLVLSCDGSLYEKSDKEKHLYPSQIHLCCNELRGNKKVIPFFFLPNIKSLVCYNINGTIGINKGIGNKRQKDISNAIDALGLDHERLRIIRLVWAYLAKGQYSLEEIRTAEKDDGLRLTIISDTGIPSNLLPRINNTIYWKLLCDYFWFYRYFQLQGSAVFPESV